MGQNLNVTPTQDNLRIEDDNGIRLLTLNRPDALNVFDTPLYDACATALHDASVRDDIVCVVLTGNGRAFSAGQDLGEMSRIDPSGSAGNGDDPGPGFPRFIDTVASFEKPLLAAVNGLGVGIGLTVLLHCDLVLIAQGARLPRTVRAARRGARSCRQPADADRDGRPARRSLGLYTGEWISADDAVTCGLALRVTEPDALLAETMEIAGRIARMPVSSLVESKRLVLAGRIDAIRVARRRERCGVCADGRRARQSRGAHGVPREAGA